MFKVLNLFFLFLISLLLLFLFLLYHFIIIKNHLVVFLLFIQINYTLFRYYQMLLILMDPFNLIFIELIIYMILYMIVNIMILLLILELGLMYRIRLFLYLGMMFSNFLRLECCCF